MYGGVVFCTIEAGVNPCYIQHGDTSLYDLFTTVCEIAFYGRSPSIDDDKIRYCSSSTRGPCMDAPGSKDDERLLTRPSSPFLLPSCCSTPAAVDPASSTLSSILVGIDRSEPHKRLRDHERGLQCRRESSASSDHVSNVVVFVVAEPHLV